MDFELKKILVNLDVLLLDESPIYFEFLTFEALLERSASSF